MGITLGNVLRPDKFIVLASASATGSTNLPGIESLWSNVEEGVSIVVFILVQLWDFYVFLFVDPNYIGSQRVNLRDTSLPS